MDFIDARLFADVEDSIPRFSAIGCLIQPPITPVFPKWALGGNVNGVAIFWMHDNIADVLTVFEPYLFEATAAISRFIKSIAIANASL